MDKKFHSVVIGGGCLGIASAISIARHLKKIGKDPSSVCLIDKMVLGGGLTARHSGIVRAANADPNAAELAKIAAEMWLNVKHIWDVELEADRCGAVWIAKKNESGGNEKWDQLEKNMVDTNIRFNKIDFDKARDIIPNFVNPATLDIYMVPQFLYLLVWKRKAFHCCMFLFSFIAKNSAQTKQQDTH